MDEVLVLYLIDSLGLLTHMWDQYREQMCGKNSVAVVVGRSNNFVGLCGGLSSLMNDLSWNNGTHER